MDAHEALIAGEVVGVPTDTVYGLAVNALDRAAVERLSVLKGRQSGKPLAVLVADIGQAKQLVDVTDRAIALAEQHWPGPVTIVLNRLDATPRWLGDDVRGTLGVRCPDQPEVLHLCESVGPLVATSANLAGQPSAISSAEAWAIFGDDVAAYVEGESDGGVASTVLDLTVEPPTTLREGPITI